MIETISDEQRRGRKKHRCDNCHGPIPPGTTYSYGYFKDGGDHWSFRSHLDCKAMAEADFAMMPNDYWEGIPALVDNDGLLEELDSWRGRFPHVVCRIELHEQLWEARNPA